MKVVWTVRNGYSDDYNWIQLGEDWVFEGEVVGYVSENGHARAVVKRGHFFLALESQRFKQLLRIDHEIKFCSTAYR